MAFFRIGRNFVTTVQRISNEGKEAREEIASIVRNHLTGAWQNATSGNLIIEKIRGGLSNSIFQVTLPDNLAKVSEEPKSVIMRFHEPLHQGTIFEHVAESLAFMFLSERKLGPKLYSVFPGGRIEEHINARPLNTDELWNREISLAIAEKMAVIHSIHAPLSRKKGIMFDLMEKWLLQCRKEVLSNKGNNSETQKCIDFFKQHDLNAEISWLRDFLGSKNYPVLFCHNDVQEGNILIATDSVQQKKPKLIFIDYEYCFYNYRGFEFANHFLEYTMSYAPKSYPYFVVNENDYPSVQHQLSFIRRYISVSKRLQQWQKEGLKNELQFYSSLCEDVLDDDEVTSVGEITEEEDRLLQETSHFRLASHLFWGIWSAVRSRSTIDFGYWEYCHARLKAYFKTKKEIKTLES